LKNPSQKRAGVGPEFKPQYHTHTQKEIPKERVMGIEITASEKQSF
jgi:hypothetical protein